MNSDTAHGMKLLIGGAIALLLAVVVDVLADLDDTASALVGGVGAIGALCVIAGGLGVFRGVKAARSR